jgi:hypothetical protein
MYLEDDEGERSVPTDSGCRVDIAVGDEGKECVGEGLSDEDIEVGDYDFNTVFSLLAQIRMDVSLADEVSVLAEMRKKTEYTFQHAYNVLFTNLLDLDPPFEGGMHDAYALVKCFYFEEDLTEIIILEKLAGNEPLIDINPACLEGGHDIQHADQLTNLCPIS